MAVRARAVGVLVAVAGAYAAASALLCWGSAGMLVRATEPGPAALDVVLGLGAAACAWIVLTRLVATFAVAVCAAAATHGGRWWCRLARRHSPELARRLAAAALGAGLAGTPLAAATAAAAPPHPVVAGHVGHPGTGPDGLPAGWSADRPAPPPGPRPAASRPTPTPTPSQPTAPLGAASPRGSATEEREVVVRPGDTLWDIAARWLGPGASAAAVAAEWPRWHAANRDRIGPDPHLILPGLHLHPPGR